MAKIKTQYVCQSCSFSTPKWLGRCPDCGAWSSFVEEVRREEVAPKAGSLSAFRAERQSAVSGAVRLGEEAQNKETSASSGRLDTTIGELNRVLGGGLVEDSFVLIGGDPGIGKSTLLLQVANGLASHKVLYASGEESISQVRSRAHRLGVSDEKDIYLMSETRLEKVLDAVEDLRPSVLIVDSLQTFLCSHLESAPGSVSQVREIASRLMTVAKSSKVAVFLVGHVTKEGSIAGPKVVEHMVDTVLYFEGDTSENYRLLRSVKNRFGSAQELGVFEMDADGLKEVKNPSALFLGDRREFVEGIAVGATLEGTRPLLVEIQALVAESHLNMPRRTSVGFEYNRMQLLCAVLERHLRLPLGGYDVYLNVSGGLRLTEPATDLAAVAAILSSMANKPIEGRTAFVGEVSLTGEIRRVNQLELRVEEAQKLGFERIIVPAASADRIRKRSKIQVIPVARVQELDPVLELRLSSVSRKSKSRESRFEASF